MTAAIQQIMIIKQVEEYTSKRMRICAHCSKLQYIKGYHTIIYRTLFGKMHIRSPQIIECSCEIHETLSSGDHSKPRAKLNFANKYFASFDNILYTENIRM